ncbi:MAG: hypothetical protein ACUVRF_09125 [Desulfotomaculales bacterium]
MPASALDFLSLVSVYVVDHGRYTNTADVTPAQKTIVTTTPAAGEVRLKDTRTLVFGDALLASNSVWIRGLAAGTQLRVS